MSPVRRKALLARGPARKRGAPPTEYSLLLTATLCLIALGAVMVFSASSARALLADGGDGAEYLKRTLIFAGVGLIVLQVASARGVRVARVLTPLLVVVAIGLLVAVALPGVGRDVNGAQRWLGSGLLQFQPSELAKLALVLYGAHVLASRPARARSLGGLGPILAVAGLCLVLIALQPDLGTAIVITAALCCLLLTAGARIRTLVPLAAAIALAAVAVVATNPYQQQRLTGFIDGGSDPDGAGYQSRQATIAVGSGGLFGLGLGESVQKTSYLPEAHTDMIAAVIGEEAGLAGMTVLIGLFGIFGYAGFRAAHRARDRYSKLLAAGLTSLIMAQATINLFAVLGLAPLTGVPLPFVSYGGTSLIVTMAAAGLILNVARGRGSAAAAAADGGSPRRTGKAGPARLRVLEGESANARRGRSRGGKSRDSGRRHGGARRTGDRRRRRAAR